MATLSQELHKLADDLEWVVGVDTVKPQELQRLLMVRARMLVTAERLTEVAKEISPRF